MKKIVLLFLITLLTLTFVNADVVVSGSADGIVVDYSSPVINYTDVEANGEVYVKITADGIGSYLEENRAELPVARVSLVVDNANATPEVEVLSVETETIALDKRVYPVQAYSTDGQPVPFSIDEAYYASEGYGAAVTEVSDPYKIRDVAGVTLAINAVRYNPARGTVTVVKSAKVLVKSNAYTRSVVDSKAFHQVYSKLFANYNGYCTRAKENFLIIAADQYMNNSQLQEFVSYKQAMYNVNLVSKSEAGNAKSYIKAQYDNTATRPTYVMLVGRATDYPYETVSGNKSYFRYTEMTGDKRPDLVLGLLFGRTEQAINNALRKAINTEKTFINMSMPYRVIHYSSFKNDSHINDEFKEIQDYWEQEGEYEIVNVLAYQMGKTDKDAMAELNKGCKFFTYQGHGFQSGWENFNALSLADNDIHPFALSFACLTGDFSYSSAVWAERWIGHEKLSTTFLGASENSSYEQKSMNRGIARGATEEDIEQIGPLVVYGKNYVYNDNGSSQHDQGQTKYHLFGDPTVYIHGLPPVGPTPTATPTATATPQYDDLALNRPVTVSGEYSAQYPKAALVDGNDSTVWGSSYNAGDQWFYVDLGKEVEIDHAIIKFYNPYYSPKYYIGVSNDAVNWDLPVTVSNGNGGDDNVQVNARGRYIGVLLTAGAMKVYGVKTFCAMVEREPEPTPIITPTPTATETPTPTPPPVDAWKAGVSYQTGDKVYHNSKVYVCTIAHTSVAGWEPGTPGVHLWREE